MNTSQLFKNQTVMVEIFNSTHNMSEWHPGYVIGVRSALDRNYRVDVKMEDSRLFAECAPECVISYNK